MGSAQTPAEALMMPADEDLTTRLRELHDDYVWRVNAAVAEGRDDLVQQLSDDYLDEATEMMTEASTGSHPACTRTNCPDCARARVTARPQPRRPRWLRLFAVRPRPRAS
jgi:hypothetical protein